MRVVRKAGFVLGVAGVLALMPIGGHGSMARAQSCDPTVSCGSGCTATLMVGYCIKLSEVHWSGSLDTFLGGIGIGPEFYAKCWACDCAYTYTDYNGNSRLLRTGGIECTAGVSGMTTTTAEPNKT